MNIGRSIARPPLHPIGGRAWRDLGRLVGEALAAGLAVSLVLALAAFIVSAQSNGADAAAAPPAPHAGTQGSAAAGPPQPAPEAVPASIAETAWREPQDATAPTLITFAASRGGAVGTLRAAERVLR
jgi:hypothetical protein